MLWVPQAGRVLYQSNVSDNGGSSTAVTTGGASNTKGTPAEVFASTSFDAYWMTILAYAYGAQSTQSAGCMDILIGAATEDILIPDLLMGNCGAATGTAGPKVWDFPIYVPAGSRIACQAAGLRLSTNVYVQVALYGGCGYPPFRVASRVTTYGIGTVPNGTAITPGVSSAWGSWTEIAASTSRDHFAFVPSFQCPNAEAFGDKMFGLEMGVGAATEQSISAYPWRWWTTTTGRMASVPERYCPDYRDVPAGTRLAARASTAATSGAFNHACVIHALS